ncbi:hypothetical protein EZS27_014959 [termite gut metagenome]|jgi:hypothetical protein|uniref:PIN domain-containing protein n=1 Tax=termite gut metagenome TaxID=433724 RepID=A0A5J4RSC9_9ZZZZ
MILPIVLDACTIINLLRIDEDDEFLLKNLKDLNLSISECVYNEVQKNANKNPLTKEQQDYITQQLPFFVTHIINPDDNLKKDYFDELKKFCNCTKDNGELHSALLSLHLCRKEGARLFFYTDDFPAKRQLSPYFIYQQIGAIGDSVDLLLFLFWSVSEFNDKQLKKYLQNLYSEYAIPLKTFLDKIETNKDAWLKAKPRDKKLRENLQKIAIGYSKLDFDTLTEAITFFKTNKTKYQGIYAIIKQHDCIDTETELTVKIKDVLSKMNNFKICKRLC